MEPVPVWALNIPATSIGQTATLRQRPSHHPSCALRRLAPELAGDCARGVNRTGAALPAYASFLELPAFRVFRTPCLALFTVAAVELRHGFSPENWENHKIHCTLGEGRSCKLLIQIWGG
jgi:hypothetical protein